MIPLRRTTSYGLAELRRYLRSGASLPPPAHRIEEWTELHPSNFDATSFHDLIPTLHPIGPQHDGEHAATLHLQIPLPRRIAADPHVWTFLSACAFPAYTLARWEREDSALSLDRIGLRVADNTLARLWWTAEHTRVDNILPLGERLDLALDPDPYWFTHRAFAISGLARALMQRDLGQLRTANIAFILHADRHHLTTPQIQEAAKLYNLALGTVAIESFQLPTDPTDPYQVDPPAIAQLLALIESILSRAT